MTRARSSGSREVVAEGTRREAAPSAECDVVALAGLANQPCGFLDALGR